MQMQHQMTGPQSSSALRQSLGVGRFVRCGDGPPSRFRSYRIVNCL